MKKMIWILIAVTLVTALPLQAMAAQNGWAFVSPIQHSYYGNRFELHTFSGNVCTKCGFVRSTKAEYNDQALALVYRNRNIIDNSCWVMYDSWVYVSSDTASMQCGYLVFGETYHVAEVKSEGGRVWILLKERADSSAPTVGWIKAENLYIDPDDHPLLPDNYIIGRTIEITASSARARIGAGTEYPCVEAVHFRERYVVLDTAIGSNGNGWYKILVDGNEVWISSGLTKLI